LHRIGSPEEVASLIAYLISKQGAYVTGQAINVCGGFEMD
jgi:NAD(P)-dependent dehydrogenase (short-subunit alcohol dehydrogenase family)